MITLAALPLVAVKLPLFPDPFPFFVIMRIFNIPSFDETIFLLVVGSVIILDAVAGDCISPFSNLPEVTGLNLLGSSLLASFFSAFSGSTSTTAAFESDFSGLETAFKLADLGSEGDDLFILGRV